jgi:hypothetical protein
VAAPTVLTRTHSAPFRSGAVADSTTVAAYCAGDPMAERASDARMGCVERSREGERNEQSPAGSGVDTSTRKNGTGPSYVHRATRASAILAADGTHDTPTTLGASTVTGTSMRHVPTARVKVNGPPFPAGMATIGLSGSAQDTGKKRGTAERLAFVAEMSLETATADGSVRRTSPPGAPTTARTVAREMLEPPAETATPGETGSVKGNEHGRVRGPRPIGSIVIRESS